MFNRVHSYCGFFYLTYVAVKLVFDCSENIVIDMNADAKRTRSYQERYFYFNVFGVKNIKNFTREVISVSYKLSKFSHFKLS